MEQNQSFVMKSTQLLSVVLSLIMVFGVTAGFAYAQTDDYDDARDGDHSNVKDRLANFCDLSDEDKRQFFEDHPKFAQFSDRLANYCDLSDYARDSKLKDFIRNNVTDEDQKKIREHVKDYDRDEDHDVDIDSVFREKLAKWCEMSDEEKSTTAAKYGKTEDQIVKSNNYCTLDESDRVAFITEHRDEFNKHMKDKMMDKPHMDYDRICSLSESDRAAEIVDAEKLERISKWCEMTLEERDDYMKEHHDKMNKVHDKMMDKPHMDYDRICSLSESDQNGVK